MRPVMYLYINAGLGMSQGKVAAQAGHAAVEAYRISDPNNSNLVRMWYEGGHYTKLVMEARNTEHLLTVERYLNDRGFKTSLIIDEGHTEIDAYTPTAVGVEIVDKDDGHVAATFGGFQLLRPPKRKATRWQRFSTGFSNATKGLSPAS